MQCSTVNAHRSVASKNRPIKMDTGRISDSGDSSSTLDGSIFTVKSDTPMLNVKQPKFRYGWCKSVFTEAFLKKTSTSFD